MEVLLLLIGLGIGAALGWFFKGHRSGQAANAAELENARLQAQLTAAGDSRQFLAAAETQLKAAAQTATATAIQSHQETFLNLANENLGKTMEQAKSELDQRHRQFSDLVKPLAENYTALNPRLDSLNTVAGRLAGALADARQVGLWGELQLRRVVEMAGMLPYSDFAEQVSIGGNRPDLVIQLPGSRSVIIDAKASLLAYQEAQEAADEAQAAAALERHAANMKVQVTDLAGKDYSSLIAESLDFTVMFIPGDQFLSAALRADPGLLEYAMTRKIVLATPASLLALLWAIHNGWQQQRLAADAAEIKKVSDEMYDRLKGFLSNYNKVGKELEQAVKAFNTSVNAFDRRVAPTGKKFATLVLDENAEFSGPELLDEPLRQSNYAEAEPALPEPEVDTKPPALAAAADN